MQKKKERLSFMESKQLFQQSQATRHYAVEANISEVHA